MVQILDPNKQVCQLLEYIISRYAKNIQFNEYKKDTEEEFYSIPLPEKEVIKNTNKGIYHFNDPQVPVILKHCVKLINAYECTNAIVYGPQSTMEWHTNSNNIGYRTYYTYTIGKGIFRYKDPKSGEFINSYDNAGWTVRKFKIDREEPLWHTIWAEKLRFAFGFNSNEYKIRLNN